MQIYSFTSPLRQPKHTSNEIAVFIPSVALMRQLRYSFYHNRLCLDTNWRQCIEFSIKYLVLWIHLLICVIKFASEVKLHFFLELHISTIAWEKLFCMSHEQNSALIVTAFVKFETVFVSKIRLEIHVEWVRSMLRQTIKKVK